MWIKVSMQNITKYYKTFINVLKLLHIYTNNNNAFNYYYIMDPSNHNLQDK